MRPQRELDRWLSRAGHLVIAFGLSAVLAGAAFAQEGAVEDDDEPAPTAEPIYPIEGAPPHPAAPEPLEEATPSAEDQAGAYWVWIPGDWLWTGEAYEWVDGVWAYPLEGYHYVAPRWEYIDDVWTFMPAGWAAEGSNAVVYGVALAPDREEEQGEYEDLQPQEVEPATTTVYVWVGVWRPPLVVLPAWHSRYRSRWYVHYRPPAAYRHPYRHRASRRAHRSRNYHRTSGRNAAQSHRRRTSPGHNTRPATSSGRNSAARGRSSGRGQGSSRSQPRRR